MMKPRKMTDAQLAYTMKDLKEVIDIQEDAVREGTMHCPELGRYWDELHDCITERNRRAKA